MPRVEVDVLIARSPEEVFRCLLEVERLPEWVGEVSDARWTTDGPAGKGSRFAQALSVMGRDVVIECELVEYEPGRHMTWRTLSGPAPTTMEWVLTPDGGATRVHVVMEMQLTGALAMLGPLASAKARGAHERNVRNLKRFVEAG